MPCRLLSVTGDIRGDDSGISFAAAAALVNTPWLHMPADAKMTVKGPTTGRETGFQGPGLVRPCANGEEEAWVAEGKFTSSPGTGERPGGEQWVVTPHAVVRYTTQIVTVDATSGGLRITTKGRVKVLKATDDNWQGVEGGDAVRMRLTTDGVVAKCVALADETRDLAAQIATPGANLKDLAPRHIDARQLARAFCAMARLRATVEGTDGGLPANNTWMQTIDTADARWRTL
jgi:hypothetical protein